MNSEKALEPCPSSAFFDHQAFSADVRAKLERDGMSYREAAPVVPCSSATLNRVARGYAPDVENYLRICRWLTGADQPEALAKPSPAPVEREGVESNIRIALWNACRWQGRPQEFAISFIQQAMAEPAMQRALAALAPEPVREDELRLAVDTLDWIVEAWVHSKPWSDEQGKRATAVLMKLNAVLNPLSAREGE